MSLLIQAVRDATPDWFLKEYPSIIPDAKQTMITQGALTPNVSNRRESIALKTLKL
jgi:hypothetical protein